ncbi:hypothetical protein [Candidatus Amarolinea aalborgensis]|uniref:hypothetical protein n=1 Tax=Candidatus Amarolinea aalborgensis TaxID=2249329 RepID=UPI003BF99740
MRRQMVEARRAVGIEVRRRIAEGGGRPAQELTSRYDHAIRTADNVITLRTTLKAVPNTTVCYTFMPKPISSVTALGCTTRALPTKTGKNLFSPWPSNQYCPDGSPTVAKPVRTAQALAAPSLHRLVSSY